jgi:hypothetical protein
MKNKRNYLRVPGERVNVALRLFKGETSVDYHTLHNISAGGLLLHTKDEMKTGDHYLLTVDSFDNDSGYSISCMSLVNRVEKRGDGFDIAFEFRWVSREDIDALNNMFESKT